jgi:hypothetical protein
MSILLFAADGCSAELLPFEKQGLHHSQSLSYYQFTPQGRIKKALQFLLWTRDSKSKPLVRPVRLEKLARTAMLGHEENSGSKDSAPRNSAMESTDEPSSEEDQLEI